MQRTGKLALRYQVVYHCRKNFLSSYGIKGQLLEWLSNYLSNRHQCVVIEGEQSQYKSIHAGVPQGSILGPLLFIMYVNDAVVDITSHIRLFADDTSLYLIVEEPEGAVNVLNHDLYKLDTWSKKWLVKFSTPKTRVSSSQENISQWPTPPCH